MTGQLCVSEFVKGTRLLLGAAAPPKESLDEFWKAWPLMRAELSAAAIPLILIAATDAGLAKLDAIRVGATASSTRICIKCLWRLGCATNSWGAHCVRFRQLCGARPSLADCAQRHDALLTTTGGPSQAAAFRAVIKADLRAGEISRGQELGGRQPLPMQTSRQPGLGVKRTRRGGRGGRTAAADPEPKESAPEEEESTKRAKIVARCAHGRTSRGSRITNSRGSGRNPASNAQKRPASPSW